MRCSTASHAYAFSGSCVVRQLQPFGSNCIMVETSKLSAVRSRFGLQPNAPLDDEHRDLEHNDLLWSRIRLVMREPFAEFFGTFIMVLFGDGSVAQVLIHIRLQPQKLSRGMS